MPEYIQNRPDLLIVSDTAVYKDREGNLLAFEPVAREIENFAHLFNRISWIAFAYTIDSEPKNARIVRGIDINYILLPAVGGRGLRQRIKIIKCYFHLLLILPRLIKKAQVIHTRGPSHPAIVASFYSLFLWSNRVFWHKYAGNWIRHIDPFTYRLNKIILKSARHSVVAVNGNWDDQPDHIKSFENPCLTVAEREEGYRAINQKEYSGILDFVFVGHLSDSKGVGRMIEAFSELDKDKRIGSLHIIGDGPDKRRFEMLAQKAGIKSVFYGFLQRDEINKVLMTSHAMILASESEGFPKVIAEGANYGCIPVVSGVSSIPQYISNSVNGFIIPELSSIGIIKTVKALSDYQGDALKKIALRAFETAALFTYERYNSRINEEILGRLSKKFND